jgi:hypothetical protein
MNLSNLPTDSGPAKSDELQGGLLEHHLNLPPTPLLAAAVSASCGTSCFLGIVGRWSCLRAIWTRGCPRGNERLPEVTDRQGKPRESARVSTDEARKTYS